MVDALPSNICQLWIGSKSDDRMTVDSSPATVMADLERVGTSEMASQPQVHAAPSEMSLAEWGPGSRYKRRQRRERRSPIEPADAKEPMAVDGCDSASAAANQSQDRSIPHELGELGSQTHSNRASHDCCPLCAPEETIIPNDFPYCALCVDLLSEEGTQVIEVPRYILNMGGDFS